MTLITAAGAGWPALRLHVFRRDRGCAAVQPRIAGKLVSDTPCRDAGGMLMAWDDLWKLEFMHIKETQAMGAKALDDEAHGVAGCPGHHRFSGWGSNRLVLGELRLYLRRLYPEIWGAAPEQPYGVRRTLRRL